MSHESRRIEEAERKVVRLYLDLANLQADINKAKDTLKDLTGGSGPGSKGKGLFPGVFGGGGGGYWTTEDGGFDWGDGSGNQGHRGGLVDADSDWDDTIPWPGSGACRLYVYVYDSSSGDPIEGATVKVSITGGSTTRTTNASGYCSFDVTNGASVTIDVSDPGHGSQSRSVTIHAGYRGIHREDFNLEASAPPGEGDPCTLDVLVKDSSGNPINDAPVRIIDITMGRLVTTSSTDSSGHATFSVDQGDSVRIDVYPTGYNSQTRTVTIAADGTGVHHETFTLDDAGANATLIVELRETGASSSLACFRASLVGGIYYDNNLQVTLSNGNTISLTYPGDNGASQMISTCHVGEIITVRTEAFVQKTAGPGGFTVYSYVAGEASVTISTGTNGLIIVLPHPTVTFEPH